MVAESLASDGVDRVLLAPTWIRTASATSLTLDSHRLVIVAQKRAVDGRLATQQSTGMR